ncbi:MAG: V-type ATP synthase subunit F [Candidatus Micrarchaeaceae archaeon]
MDELAVVGEREVVLGFKLIGIQDVFIEEGSNAVKKIEELAASGRYGLILVSESIRKVAGSSKSKQFESSLKPLIVFIPLLEMKNKRETMEQLAKRILGIDIEKLKFGKNTEGA